MEGASEGILPLIDSNSVLKKNAFMKNFILSFMLLLVSCHSSDGNNPSAITPKDDSSTPIETDSPSVTKTWTEEFMTLINDHRTSIGLDSLTHDEGLGEIVQTHSSNMAKGITSFGHTGFSSRCSQGKSLIGGGNWCGENVAMGQKTPAAAYKAWMNSSGHKANIEKRQATHTGFGYAKSSSGSYYWTQIFIEKN